MSIIETIVKARDYRKMIREHPEKYQFVTIGPQQGHNDKNRLIGYCVQVRKGCGQFGSDAVLLRHPNGDLVVHENQSYFPLTEEQEGAAKSLFEVLPEDEDDSLGYIVRGEGEEIGFLIEGLKTQDSSCSMIIKTSKDFMEVSFLDN